MKKKPFLYLHQYFYIISKEKLGTKEIASSMLNEGGQEILSS